MKKAVLFLAFNFIGLTSFAQSWNYDNQNFLYSGSNALMIGTATQIAGYGNPPDGRGLELYSPSSTLFTMKSGNYSLQLLNSPIYGNNLYMPNNQPFTFSMSGVSNPALRIQTNGNIGINTNLNPIGYKLAVGGKIIAEELKVQLQTAPWPDYVFAFDYKLPTLAEVEAQIKKEGHLANMPSAVEVNCEGFEVGEITRLQQEKIEELTLYIIELNKINDKQNTELENQRKEIEELKIALKSLLENK